ncbi:hypothetical protein [Kribbella catacumbae]|uniref:hypothetical protein n=1 Tax=Kribbella catacumbae TaxID=460086 RepID=UPI0003691A7D|nr:hypothetical protein [Kribbella catacumbae]
MKHLIRQMIDFIAEMMLMRKTFLVTAVLAAGIGVFGAAPASASPAPATETSYAVQGWERVGEYSTFQECNADGKLSGGRYVCELTVPDGWWVLYVWRD